MADPPRRVTENGTELVLVDPTDRRLKPEERQALSLETFREIENQLLEESAQGLAAALAWPEIDPASEAPPEEWVKSLGYRDAMKKFRIAKAANLSTKDAPVGIKIFQNTYLGIRRVQAADNQMPTQVNYTVVELPAPLPQFPEKEVEARK